VLIKATVRSKVGLDDNKDNNVNTESDKTKDNGNVIEATIRLKQFSFQ